MNRQLFAIWILFSIHACFAFSLSYSDNKNFSLQKEKDIIILHENDVHCNIDKYPRLTGLRDSLSAFSHVLLVSSGDFLQGGTAGAISGGQYISDIMKSVGYDAVTLGNHEFDFGAEKMKELLAAAGLPIADCNLYDCETGKRVYVPYILKDCGSRRLAFVGVTTPSTLETESYAFYDEKGVQTYHLCKDSLYTVVQRNVNAARKAGADYVIVLAHLGESPDTINGFSHGLLAATNGIDLLLDGHSHSVVTNTSVKNKDGKEVPIAQTGSLFANIGIARITSTGDISTSLFNDSIPLTPGMRTKAVVDSINALMSEKVNEVICYSSFPLRILDDEDRQLVRLCETPVGNLVTDAYRTLTGAEIAMSNGGGMRTDIPAGNITFGNILSLLPYENYVCVVEVSGAMLLETLEACCSGLPYESGDFPQVSGIRFTIDLSSSPRIKNLMVYDTQANDYVPIDLERKYSLATINYCITGGGFKNKLHNCKILKDNLFLYSYGLREFLKNNIGSTLPDSYSKPQNRIQIIY